MSKRIYISADYSEANGDRNVVNELHRWGSDDKHKVDYCDTAEVVSGSVANDSDCRSCDLKKEFNIQINVSSAVIFIVGDRTASRIAGSSCKRISEGRWCDCTPYKQNMNGKSICKIIGDTYTPAPDDDLGSINSYSYLKHEFKQAERKNKNIIVVYNSLRNQPLWLPNYMNYYKDIARPFWKLNKFGVKVGDYYYIKQVLGYE